MKKTSSYYQSFCFLASSKCSGQSLSSERRCHPNHHPSHHEKIQKKSFIKKIEHLVKEIQRLKSEMIVEIINIEKMKNLEVQEEKSYAIQNIENQVIKFFSGDKEIYQICRKRQWQKLKCSDVSFLEKLSFSKENEKKMEKYVLQFKNKMKTVSKTYLNQVKSANKFNRFQIFENKTNKALQIQRELYRKPEQQSQSVIILSDESEKAEEQSLIDPEEVIERMNYFLENQYQEFIKKQNESEMEDERHQRQTTERIGKFMVDELTELNGRKKV